jgi:hypothetical protein
MQRGDGLPPKPSLSDRRAVSVWLKAPSTAIASLGTAAGAQVSAQWLPRYVYGQDYFLGAAVFFLALFLIWRALDRASPRVVLLLSGIEIILLVSIFLRVQFDNERQASGETPAVASGLPAARVSNASPSPVSRSALPQNPAPPSPPVSPATPYLPLFPSSARASSFYIVPSEFLRGSKTFGEAANSLLHGLEKAGYRKRSLFFTENSGVAVVTRLERINEDGTPSSKGNRWPGALKPFDYRFNAGIDAVLRGLFEIEAGRYRVFVFLLSSLPPLIAPKEVPGDEAVEWLSGDASTLPKYLAGQPIKAASLMALVYEFESDGTKVKVIQSPVSSQVHLSKSHILASLGAP